MKVKNIRKYLTEEQITERVKAMGECCKEDQRTWRTDQQRLWR